MLDLGLMQFHRFPMPERIEGEKCLLIRRQHDHDFELFRLIDESRDFLRRFLFWIDATKTVQDVAQVTDIFSKNWNEQASFEYVFLNKKTHQMVGAGGIHTIVHMNKTAEYGYYLHKDAVGNGYASEVVSLLTHILFQKGIHRVVIQCDADNKASAQVAKRNGFILEGRLRDAKYAYGAYRDELIFSKLNLDE